MTETIALSLHAALADLARWLSETHIPSMIIGGVAASVLGRPRLTQDIDALAILPEEDWAAAMAAAARFGIRPRIADALQFARRSRVLLMRHESSGIDLDITFGGLPFEQSAIQQSEARVVGGISVQLPRVEDLLVMKAIARRPKDIEDIRGLLAAHPGADVAAARRWVREFATAMSMSDILEEFDKLLAQCRPKG